MGRRSHTAAASPIAPRSESPSGGCAACAAGAACAARVPTASLLAAGCRDGLVVRDERPEFHRGGIVAVT